MAIKGKIRSDIIRQDQNVEPIFPSKRDNLDSGAFAKIGRKIASQKNIGVQIKDEQNQRKTQRDMGPSGWENLAQRGKTCSKQKKLESLRKLLECFYTSLYPRG